MATPLSMPAKRAIRCKRTGHWLTPDARWTSDFREALLFNNIADVVFTADRHTLTDVELVLRFDSNTPWDISVDIY